MKEHCETVRKGMSLTNNQFTLRSILDEGYHMMSSRSVLCGGCLLSGKKNFDSNI